MKHKVCCRLCAIVIAVSAVMGIYVRSVQAPLRAQTYTISPWETLYVFAARPAFWSCSGILVALALLRLRVGPRPRKVLYGAGPLSSRHTARPPPSTSWRHPAVRRSHSPSCHGFRGIRPCSSSPGC